MLLRVLLLPLFANLCCATDIQTTAPFVAELLTSVIPSPRGLMVDSFGDVLVTSNTTSTITAVRETIDGNGKTIVKTALIVNCTDLGLTHGIAFNNGFLYASSMSTVYRWPYMPGQFALVDETRVQEAIVNMESGGHFTRILRFNSVGILYVSIGSFVPVDPDSSRARIRRFDLSAQMLPIQFSDGEVFADGVRNTVGLAFNSNDILFGVDNQAGPLIHPTFGEIASKNPGEEMNKFNHPSGTHYGYPYCWSTYNLPGYAPATQFVWPGFDNFSDEYCQDPNKNVPPIMSMPAHAAPLSIEFYKGENCGIDGGFPCSSIGDAFVGFRGSGFEGVHVGYKVTWFPFNSSELPTGEEIDVIFAANVTTHSCNTCLRPVSAIFNKKGHLIVSADATSEIFKVTYRPDDNNSATRLYATINFVFVVLFSFIFLI